MSQFFLLIFGIIVVVAFLMRNKLLAAGKLIASVAHEFASEYNNAYTNDDEETDRVDTVASATGNSKDLNKCE